MKATRIAIILALMLVGASAGAQNCTTLLNGRKFSKYPTSTGTTLNGGNLQGAAYYGGKIYSFKQDNGFSPSRNNINIYDIASNTWAPGDTITCAPGIHMGSACFAPTVVNTYTKDGQTYHCTIPFVLATGHNNLNGDGTLSGNKTIYTAVIDIENNQLIRVVKFKDRYNDAIMAYDFSGNKLWVVGYLSTSLGDKVDKKGMSPYVINEYAVNFNDILSTASVGDNLDYSSQTPKRTQVGGPNANGIQETLECGTVQDLFYHDNHIYICTGRGSLYNRTEYTKIHCYYVGDNQNESVIDKTVPCVDYAEAQGLVFDGTNIWMLTSKNLWKYGPGSGYDNYNFQEPAETSPATTYSITNGSELCWFLQQVYCGRTTINAVLAQDIDMTGITLPTASYINYADATEFDAQYAFRGTFDGAGHSISNLSISSTPFYNTGLFPWVIGATIKDVTVSGNIQLSKSTSIAPGDSDDIANIGLIGNAEGNCTITGVDVSEFTINNPSNLSTSNVGPLVGNGNGVDYSAGNVIAGDHTSGHQYNADGVCIATGDCNAKYEAPELVSGVYQITKAGHLFWLAQTVNSGSTGVSAKLMNDIDMKGGKYGSFPSIGDATNPFAGTFDGQGFTISNFYQEIASGFRTGFFGIVKGASSTNKATVKNFKLSGTKSIKTGNGMHGSVAGDVQGYGVLEDVICSVDISCTVNASIVGGLTGCILANGSVNRCTYSGTMNCDPGHDRFGGLVGEIRGGSISNSLFDGTIISTSSNSSLCIGGIAGATGNADGSKISNCLSHGSFSIGHSSDYCGIVLGNAVKTVTFTQCYYTSNGSLTAVGSSSVTVSGAPIIVSNDEDLTSGELNELLGETDWIQGPYYPIPLIGGNGVHTHKYDADGFCRCGTFEEPELEGGYYIIKNAGNFLAFVAKTASDATVCAKLNNCIDLKNREFAGIGTGSKKYSGTFDGNGHEITGILRETNTNVSGTGFFNYTDGATIRNLTLKGQFYFSNTSGIYGIGSVVGIPNNTTIKDVHSDINMTFTNCPSGIRLFAGLVGRATGSSSGATLINRCRYSGTMDFSESQNAGDRIAGIAGDIVNTTISNCLFDGVIKVKATSGVTVGGILAKNNGTPAAVSNCLFAGSIQLEANTSISNCGKILGVKNGVTLSNSYSAGELTVGGTSSQCGTNASDGTAVASWEATLAALGTDNWHMDSSETYPIPGVSHSPVSYIILDDEADAMPSLEGATHIRYTRAAKYMKGMISVCLPFGIEPSMLPGSGCKLMIYNSCTVEGNTTKVKLEEVKTVPAGVPCIIQLDAESENKDWTIEVNTSVLKSTVVNPDGGKAGIYGSFSTVTTGEGRYKLNADGTALLKTTSSSHCYPYRAYVVLPAEGSTKVSIGE